jgi:ABC-type multidrug transport system fused ATPase/permease subunit
MNIVWINRLSRYGLSKSIILVLFLLSLLSIITQMMGLGIFIPVFEYIFSGNEALNGDSKGSVFYFVTFIEYLGLSPSLELLLLIAFLFYFISQISNFFIVYVNTYFSGKMVRDMRSNFLSYYLGADSEYYDRVKISDVVNITFSELGGAVHGVLAPIKLMVAIVSSVGSIVVLFLLSYELTIYSIFNNFCICRITQPN